MIVIYTLISNIGRFWFLCCLCLHWWLSAFLIIAVLEGVKWCFMCFLNLYSSTLAWKNPMDGGAWWAAVHGVAKSQTRLSNFTFTFHFHALEEEMAIHSSVLAWRIPGTAGPGGLPSMGSHRVGHNWSDLAAAAMTINWASLVAQLIKNLPAMWETWVWSLGLEHS